jgi:hypothetical protein
VLAGRFDTSLLLNTDFSQSVPLYPVDRGSRPKGWRAAPLLTRDGANFGVRIVPDGETTNSQETRHATIGFGAKPGATHVRKGERAVLAQEMRNPRAGRFTFTVEACVTASNRQVCEEFQKHFSCRLVMFRFADGEKNPLKRQELGSLVIQPPLIAGTAPAYATFDFSRVLDGAAPGQNFSIGQGLGVSIEVEKTSDGTLSIRGPDLSSPPVLRIRSARLTFASRTINDKVVV